MSQISPVLYLSKSEKVRSFLNGCIAVLPLTIAVLPWSLLTGSLAIDYGFNMIQSQALSGVVFAGAVQLAVMDMIKDGVSLGIMVMTTLMITSRHFLYSMTMRNNISTLPLKWRLSLGFLLTDELFAIANPNQLTPFDRWYALGGGFSFYLGWNLATFVGILAGKSIENLNSLGFDFAIAATFTALVVPSIKNVSVLVCVVTALVTSIMCELLQLQATLLISAPLAMLAGFLR